jgi:photosystem II stability/assembly factor-like uncharacterized protein
MFDHFRVTTEMLYNLPVRSFAIVFAALSILPVAPFSQTSKLQETGFDTNLRGVSISQTPAGKYVVWVSGSKGIILRSPLLANLEEGKSWKQLKVHDGPDLDFRDIEAFGANTAYVMSSGDGEKSRIYKTVDAGKSWTLQYTDKRAGFFLDSLACASKTRCLALSDPVEGKFLLLRTTDGQHWKELPRDKMPAALPTEGAFAASGTSIAICHNDLYFGTGGPAARVFHSPDRGRSWTVTETPIASGNASSGIFSVACADQSVDQSNDRSNKHYVLVVGGDYKNPAASERVAAFSNDRGETWHLSNQQPGGYRSSIRFACGEAFAVGPTGEDTSLDYGAHWKSVDALNMNAASLTPGGLGWAVGPSGTFKHFQLEVLDLIHHHGQREKDIGMQ